MIVVLDTNALVQIFGARSPFARLQQAILDGRLTLAVSTAILLEYGGSDIPLRSPDRWPRVWRALEMTEQLHENLRRIAPAFRWRSHHRRPGRRFIRRLRHRRRAEWIVTEDAHFDVLKDSGHQPQPISPAEFIARFLAEA